MTILKAITQEEFDEIYEQHQVWYNDNSAGNRMDLSNYNLWHIKFQKKSNLNDAMLSGANLQGKTLRNMFFNRANLIHANLHMTNFKNTEFCNADLRSANCDETIFDDAKLCYANLQNIKSRETSFCNANLSGTKFSIGSLQFVYLNKSIKIEGGAS